MQEKLRIELPKREYEMLEKLSKKFGLTADQGAQMALLYYFNGHAPGMMEKLEKIVDPKVLREYEKEPL